MKKVAKFAFNTDVLPEAEREQLWNSIGTSIDSWLCSKGQCNTTGNHTTLTYKNGVKATVKQRSDECDAGVLRTLMLDEPTTSGLFRTDLKACHSDSTISISCELSVGTDDQKIAPAEFSVFCPRVIRSIIELGSGWKVCETPITSKYLSFDSVEDGEFLARIISDGSRTIPIIAVSENQGPSLIKDFLPGIAFDLAGLALAVKLTSEASWGLTYKLGAEWSCYNGAVRIYWPIRSESESSNRHQYWKIGDLLANAATIDDASSRLREQLRRRILDLSTLTVREHPHFSKLKTALDKRDLDQQLSAAKDDQELLRIYASDNDNLRDKIQTLTEQIEELKADKANLLAMTNWSSKKVDSIEPTQTEEVKTVSEAVAIARAKYSDNLIFGSDVDTGVAGLDSNAGPPEKILNHLTTLNSMCHATKSGSLGASRIQWLNSRNCPTSGEPDGIKNCKAERAKRTWDDGKAKRYFDLHTKPKEATSPDKCVRIYFDVDEENSKIIIGWIGRHP